MTLAAYTFAHLTCIL